MKKPRPKWLGHLNRFRLLPPGQTLIAKAAKAGVDTRSKPAIEHWKRTGEIRPPSHFGKGYDDA